MIHPFRPDWRAAYLRGEPLRIGNGPQFLFDDYLVEDQYGTRRVTGPVEKARDNPLETGPVMPWENAGSSPRQILYDPEEGLYKGWYGVCPNLQALRLGHGRAYHYHTCYAESDDGLRWRKPALDLFSWDEHARTNIVLKEEGATCLLEDIWLTPNPEGKDRRFSALVKTVPPGEGENSIVLMHSSDGRTWRPAPEPVLFRGASDGSYSLVHHPDARCWMLYRRPPTRAMVAHGFYNGHVKTLNTGEEAKGSGANTKRRASVCMSDDFTHWTHPRGIALPDELDPSDVDSIKVVRDRDLFFGFIGLMDNPGLLPKSTHLIFSRDGLHWERLPDRRPFIANGAPGEWDAGQIAVHTLLPDGQRLRIYYCGTAMPQKEHRLPRVGGTGLACLEQDRWIGRQAGPEGGFLLTRQFVFDGDRLAVNCRCPVARPASGFEGMLMAELLREPVEHHPASAWPGFSMDDCDPVAVGDNPDQLLTWRGSPDLSALRGKPVYIRFFLRNATLYTFRADIAGRKEDTR